MPARSGAVPDSSGLAREVGRRVRERRKSAGLTQIEAAERLAMTAEAYARIERGASVPSCRTLVRICVLLRITPDTLLLPEPPGPEGVREDETEPGEDSRSHRLWTQLRSLDPGTQDLVERLILALASRRG